MFTEWYENGVVKEKGNFLNSEPEGEWIINYPSGEKDRELIYVDGLPNGLVTQWYENGQKKQEGTGDVWTEWNEDGSIK